MQDMGEELNLVRDLAVILISAGVFTVISKALKQPLILGYIVAGFLIGPGIDFFPGISSEAAVHQWSDLGIIFLMFGLGLEFSFKKLLKVGAGALTTAGIKFIGMFLVGYLTGTALGWTSMESIFLAGLLSMSSTMVVVKAMDEMGLKQESWSGMVFGILIVEDLLAILLMVLFSTLGASSRFEGSELVGVVVKMVFFVVLWFLVGIYVIPTLLKKARSYINDEILLIVSIGLCFGMVALASAAGFSSALGAFVMGSILAETVESDNIDKLVKPIKDLFGAIFFVSVGMMVSPQVIGRHWAVILLLTLLVLFFKTLVSVAGVLASGKGLHDASYSGFTLSQLGEFGFILAGLGVSMGVVRSDIYPIIIAVSAITTFTTPYMIRLAGPAYGLMQRKLPERVLERIDRDEEAGAMSPAENGEWKVLFKNYLLRVGLYSVVLTAISIGSSMYLEPLVARLFGNLPDFWVSLLSVLLTIGVMSPFLYGLAINTSGINKPALKLLSGKKGNTLPIIALMLLRIFIAIGFILATISNHFTLRGWTLVLFISGTALFLFMGRRFLHKYNAVEKRFLRNLNEKENARRRLTPVASSISDKMAGYDVHIETVVLQQDSVFAGRRIKELPIRSGSGVNIVKIQRGSRSIVIPNGSEPVYPGDRLVAVGSTEQIEAFRSLMESSVEVHDEPDTEFKVVSITLGDDSYLTGKTLKETNMRDFKYMVISVLRNGTLITNPHSDFKFERGDTVWVAGDPDSCEWIK